MPLATDVWVKEMSCLFSLGQNTPSVRFTHCRQVLHIGTDKGH